MVTGIDGPHQPLECADLIDIYVAIIIACNGTQFIDKGFKDLLTNKAASK
jgi:hypothetical protein